VFRNLEAELSRKGMSKKELSEEVGIEYKTLLNYLSGTTNINLKAMLLIKRKVFPEFTIDYLFEDF
jgi:transcriptional regulator with XRE-family HTH domain